MTPKRNINHLKKQTKKNNESDRKSIKNQLAVYDSISFKDYLTLENTVRDFNYLHIKKGAKVINPLSLKKGIVISVSQMGAYKTAKVLFEGNTIPEEVLDVNWLQLDLHESLKGKISTIKLKDKLHNYAIKNISVGTVVEHPSIGTVNQRVLGSSPRGGAIIKKRS